jgi:predicted NBD/HSP70 family sugar kinase
VRGGDGRRRAIWEEYLRNLAIVINNTRMVLDSEYVIGGYLMKFMNDGDLALLAQYAQEECPFESKGVKLRRSVYSEDAAAPGAGISLVKAFLDTVL